MKLFEGTSRGALLVAPVVLLLAAMLIGPLGLMLVDSFLPRGRHGVEMPPDLGAYLVSGEFLQHYARALDVNFALVLLRTVIYAVLSTLLCLLFGYPIAYTLAMHFPGRLRSLALLGISVPLWTSFVVRTFAWVWLLQTKGLVNRLLEWLGLIDQPLQLLYNEGAVLLGLVYYELPFMILPIYASVERLDRRYLEAAADLGATPWTAFWKITWPLTRPGVIAGSALVFIPAAGQYVINDMLGGGTNAVIGNIIQNQVAGSGKNAPFGFALTFMLTALVLTLLAVSPNVAKHK